MVVSNRWYLLLVMLATSSAISCGTVHAQVSRIEIEIRNTPVLEDDYVTWAPTKARIRQQGGAADLRITLTNDSEGPIVPGREHPLDGNLVFDSTLLPGETATKDTLDLVLPQNGAWRDLIVAGKFPRASSSDKDAIIEVHDGISGAVLHSHPLMVRIRKDYRKLTEGERDRLIEAFDYMHRKKKSSGFQSRYTYFSTMHKIGVWGVDFGMAPEIAHFWPDVGHKGPAFITWHRVFLLQFEREIQEVFPDVSLPYWIMPEKSGAFDLNLFDAMFMGTNAADPLDPTVEVMIDPNNLLFGWSVEGNPLVRAAAARDPDHPTFPPFRTDSELFAITKFSEYPAIGGFVYSIERNPHNIGHGWVGGWMASCLTSPQDPIFWIFHTGFDRQWAHWQYLYGRFNADGSGDSYHPIGTFPEPPPATCDAEAPNQCPPIGHSSGDAMWPWNEKAGAGSSVKGSWPQHNLASPFLSALPAARLAGLWPESPAAPTPSDTIDYAGLTVGRLDMGFAYDDSPFGAKPPSPAVVAELQPADNSLRVVLDAGISLPERLAAGNELASAQLDESQIRLLLDFVRTPTEDDPRLRVQVLRSLQNLPAPTWMSTVADILKPSSGADTALQLEGVHALTTELMFGSESHIRRHTVADILRAALGSDDHNVRAAALRALAPMGDTQAVAVAIAALEDRFTAQIPIAESIRGLVAAGRALDNRELIRTYLASEDPTVRAVAASAVALDPQSRGLLLNLLTDAQQPYEVRSTAIRSLAAGAYGLLPGVMSVLANPQEDTRLRAEAIAALGVVLRSEPTAISTPELDRIIATLGDASDGDAIGLVLQRTLNEAATVLATRGGK